MTAVKQLFAGLLYINMLVIGFALYLVTKKTPAFAYQSMIRLFCLTKGYSNDYLSRLIGVFRRPYRFHDAAGILGDMSDASRRASIVSSLRDRGFYVFEKRLPDKICDRLLQYATSHRCQASPMDEQRYSEPVWAVYRRNKTQAVRYEFSANDLLANHDVQAILADLSFAAIAQDYLGAKPVIDVLSMWWLTDFSNKPDSKAAQYFHFDMDRPKWLKVFIYLTDVGAMSGPHTFIAGSHKSGRIPTCLLSKGYARLSDEEVSRVFDKRDIIEFTAPRGTIIVEDTRGLHKGKQVEQGDRLILQIQFSNCLFGGVYPKASLNGSITPELSKKMIEFPSLYSAYL